ncbi:MAG TPA: aminopeptidase [Longimicrobiales bacterium]
MIRRLLLFLAAAATAAILLTCSPVYVLRAGIEEVRILSRRTPIEQILGDPATDAGQRRKLELVLQARTFASRALGLDVGGSYTTYSWVDRDTLALVLSAARKDRFEQKTWWFPIVGHVPYKGYFSPKAALAAAEELERQGYDTYIRPTSAFSTLGWFDDPLLSTVLRADDVDLVSTVIHELAHNTIYVPSQVSFNESFASFVGDRGAIAFFCGIEGENGQRCRTARDRWEDNLLFGRFLQELVAELEALYARVDLPLEDRLARREVVFQRARDRFRTEVQPRLRSYTFGSFLTSPLNNATLIARRLYYDRLDLFEAAFQRHGQDLPATIRSIVAAAQEGADPFDAVSRLTAP